MGRDGDGEAGRDPRDVGGRERAAAEVHAVGAHGERDVDAVVDVEGRARGARDLAQVPGELEEGARLEILLAQLDGDRAARLGRHGGERGAHDLDERAPLRSRGGP